MKRCCLFIAALLAVKGLQAQLLAEVFAQKKTQIEYLTQQIAALQVYLGYMEKGYRIAKEGLNTINDLKHGEFNLHDDYYHALQQVSPGVAKDARIGATIALQAAILKRYGECYRGVQKGGRLNEAEIRYLYAVFEGLTKGCAHDLSVLTLLVTSGKMQLTDEERFRRIDAVYRDMQDKYAFVQSVSRQADLLALARAKEENDTRTMQAFYHLQ